MNAIAKRLRKALVDTIKSYPEKEVAVMMSSGVDSHTVLFAALEAGKKVHCYSFTMDTHESRDFLMAKNTAEALDLPFTKITLPSSEKTLLKDVTYMIQEMGCDKKTHIECFWPMMYAIKKIKQRVVLTGHGADNYYCLSRKAYQHYHGRWDEYRALSFADPKWSQKLYTNGFGEKYGKWFAYPYHTKRVFNAFKGTTYGEINKPRQKSPSRDAFAEQFAKCKVYNHMPFQLGDSGISTHFEKLVSMSCNTTNAKTVVGVYNSIRKG